MHRWRCQPRTRGACQWRRRWRRCKQLRHTTCHVGSASSCPRYTGRRHAGDTAESRTRGAVRRGGVACVAACPRRAESESFRLTGARAYCGHHKVSVETMGDGEQYIRVRVCMHQHLYNESYIHRSFTPLAATHLACRRLRLNDRCTHQPPPRSSCPSSPRKRCR